MFEVGNWMRNTRGSDSGGRSEQQKGLVEQMNMKFLEIPGMDGDQKSKILEKIIELMEEIERDEKVLQENAQKQKVETPHNRIVPTVRRYWRLWRRYQY
jgi:hypothetical protein